MRVAVYPGLRFVIDRIRLGPARVARARTGLFEWPVIAVLMAGALFAGPGLELMRVRRVREGRLSLQGRTKRKNRLHRPSPTGQANVARC